MLMLASVATMEGCVRVLARQPVTRCSPTHSPAGFETCFKVREIPSVVHLHIQAASLEIPRGDVLCAMAVKHASV